MKKTLIILALLAISCGKIEENKHPITVSVWSSEEESVYSQEFQVDSVNGNIAYKNGLKIELKKVRYIIFK